MIDIIMSTWNLKDTTLEAINSLRENTIVPYRLIIVDNKSDDGLEKELEVLSKKDDVKVIVPDKRLSLAKAINLGIEESRTKYVAYTTNDLEFKNKRWLKGLRKTISRNNKTGMVGCKILFSKGLRSGRVMHGGASYWDWDNSSVIKWRHFGYDKMDDGSWDRVREVPGVTIAVCLFRKEALIDVGMFNEEYKGSGICIDCELCCDLRKKGWKIYYDGTVTVHHKNRASDSLRSKSEHSKDEKWNMNYFYSRYRNWIKRDKKKNKELYEGIR